MNYTHRARKIDPLWIRPESGWPKVFESEPREVTKEEADRIEQELCDSRPELEKKLAAYHNPITYETMRQMFD